CSPTRGHPLPRRSSESLISHGIPNVTSKPSTKKAPFSRSSFCRASWPGLKDKHDKCNSDKIASFISSASPATTSPNKVFQSEVERRKKVVGLTSQIKSPAAICTSSGQQPMQMSSKEVKERRIDKHIDLRFKETDGNRYRNEDISSLQVKAGSKPITPCDPHSIEGPEEAFHHLRCDYAELTDQLHRVREKIDQMDAQLRKMAMNGPHPSRTRLAGHAIMTIPKTSQDATTAACTDSVSGMNSGNCQGEPRFGRNFSGPIDSTGSTSNTTSRRCRSGQVKFPDSQFK
ncbi:unnamed protein product, partial [Protopolystoma xenopodis]